ncbi:MAG TPA: hypothetical protein DEG10_08430 [Leclercia adecarboxylata]|nr:hypothetical protein [Leclercia adecarboxylata]
MLANLKVTLCNSGLRLLIPQSGVGTRVPHSDIYMSRQCLSRKITVALAEQPKGWPVSFVSGISTPVSVTTLERGNSGGDSSNTKEIIIMMTAPAQSHPKFIWIIAAVRRDCPTIKPVLHHIPAVSEREARRMLARDHVYFFAGRIRQEVAA